MNTALLLLAQYGKALLTLEETAQLFNWSLKTAQNRLAMGTFPIPTVKTGSSVLVRVPDIANYVDQCAEADQRDRKRLAEQVRPVFGQRDKQPSSAARPSLPRTRRCRPPSGNASPD